MSGNGPNADHLGYNQAKAWFPRTKVLTGTLELAVTEADCITEGCENVKEIQVYAITGDVLATNRSDSTDFVTIEEGAAFLFPLDGTSKVWIKGGTALVVALGFKSPSTTLNP